MSAKCTQAFRGARDTRALTYCPEYKQTPERGQVQGYWSLTGSLLAVSTELREAVLLCHAVTLCCILRYKIMPLTD